MTSPSQSSPSASHWDFEEGMMKKAETLFRKTVSFVLGVAQLAQLPDDNRSEVAFAGRSNVGKSSLLNALTNRKTLARTSNTPGRTQQMNFFDLDGEAYLVDLPGYGYAKVSKSLVKEWTKTLKKYLKGRPNLRMTCLLVDGRHGIKKNDEDMMVMLDEAAVSYQVVLTKGDKLKDKERDDMLSNVRERLKKHPAAYPEPLFTSSKTGLNLDNLRARIVSVL
jgi:GTP-binding protein